MAQTNKQTDRQTWRLYDQLNRDKNQNSNCDKTQIATKLKNTNCDKIQKLKLQQYSNSNCEKNQHKF